MPSLLFSGVGGVDSVPLLSLCRCWLLLTLPCTLWFCVSVLERICTTVVWGLIFTDHEFVLGFWGLPTQAWLSEPISGPVSCKIGTGFSILQWESGLLDRPAESWVTGRSQDSLSVPHGLWMVEKCSQDRPFLLLSLACPAASYRLSARLLSSWLFLARTPPACCPLVGTVLTLFQSI